jgi:hypothetical protein
MTTNRKSGSKSKARLKDATKGNPWEICAYRLTSEPVAIVQAPVKREWMHATSQHFATRCLPMMIANQAGWFILNPHPVVLTWNGGAHPSELVVEHPNGIPPKSWVTSHFGYGIATWRIPCLFRTPVNFDLLVRGPANWPKANAFALEGIVETDWLVGTFTMNWQLQSPGTSVTFDENEPICMIVPYRKTDLEQFSAVSKPVSTNPALAALNGEWSKDRAAFIAERDKGDWQKDYVRGIAVERKLSRQHKTRIHLSPFREE